MPKINHEILIWARETAGLTVEEAAEKLLLRDARGLSGAARLLELEAGHIDPTRPMLVRMAKQYRRPLLVFYLSRPPRKADRGQDFRTLPESYSAADDALLDVLIRDVLARQNMLRAVLEDEDEVEPLTFIGSANIQNGVAPVVKILHEVLGVSHEDYYSQPNTEQAFLLLRAKVEAARVFVLLIGNLGSYHTSMPPDIFRGFALADQVAPFIIINDQDSHAAWSFTLLHELAHLLLGQTGVSGAFAGTQIERFCNDVAGEFLLPQHEVAELDLTAGSFEELQSIITRFAGARNLSSSMVAYKLLRIGAIDLELWKRLSAAYREWWLEERQKRREHARDQEGGANYYVVRQHRVGKGLIQLVDRMIADGALSTSKAGKVLGVKAKNVGSLIEASRAA